MRTTLTTDDELYACPVVAAADRYRRAVQSALGSASNTPSTTQTWKCTCVFRLEPKRWMNATAARCRLVGSTSAAPGQWVCRLCWTRAGRFAARH